MELFERRRYFFCTFCGSFSFIDTPEVEGVRVLERPVPARDCPLCGSPLAKALLDDAFAVETASAVAGSCSRGRGFGSHRPPAGTRLRRPRSAGPARPARA